MQAVTSFFWYLQSERFTTLIHDQTCAHVPPPPPPREGMGTCRAQRVGSNNFNFLLVRAHFCNFSPNFGIQNGFWAPPGFFRGTRNVFWNHQQQCSGPGLQWETQQITGVAVTVPLKNGVTWGSFFSRCFESRKRIEHSQKVSRFWRGFPQ